MLKSKDDVLTGDHRFRLFTKHVALPDERGCMIWTAGHTVGGYGVFGIKVNGRWRNCMAHRFAYEHFVGPVPNGLELDHLCRNRACVNPTHLEPVTRRENIMRGEGVSAKHAAKTHCPKGHLYAGSNLRIISTGGRQCRACQREKYRETHPFIRLDSRLKTHCDHGHEFTTENTYWRVGWRTCKTCKRGQVQRYRARKKLMVEG